VVLAAGDDRPGSRAALDQLELVLAQVVGEVEALDQIDAGERPIVRACPG